MTEQSKALEALNAIVTAYCMSLGMEPPIPDPQSQTAEQVRTIRAALAPLPDLADRPDQMGAREALRQLRCEADYAESHHPERIDINPGHFKKWLDAIEAGLSLPSQEVNVVSLKREIWAITDKEIDNCFGDASVTGIYDVDSGNLQALVGRVFDRLIAGGYRVYK